MRAARGFTLLELLLVCAIIGILGAVGTLTLRGAIQSARLNEASTQLAADLKRARSGAQRFNQASSLTLAGSPATEYTVTVNGQTLRRALPNGVRVTADTQTITYGAPFGEIAGAAGLTLKVELGGMDDAREIKVLGVTGKVYTQKASTP